LQALAVRSWRQMADDGRAARKAQRKAQRVKKPARKSEDSRTGGCWQYGCGQAFFQLDANS